MGIKWVGTREYLEKKYGNTGTHRRPICDLKMSNMTFVRNYRESFSYNFSQTRVILDIFKSQIALYSSQLINHLRSETIIYEIGNILVKMTGTRENR